MTPLRWNWSANTRLLTEIGLASATSPARLQWLTAASTPFRRLVVFGWLGLANYMLKRYGEAVPRSREYASRQPDLQWPHLWLAAACAQLGQLEEARAEAAEVLRVNPGFATEGYKRLLVHKAPEDAEHRLDGLRKAGLPES
jgi:tetratricopeptide (TPR) repeat protein